MNNSNQKTEEGQDFIARDPQAPPRRHPVGDPVDRPGTDWSRGEGSEPNIQPENFPGANRAISEHPEDPGTPGVDPDPRQPGPPAGPPTEGQEPDMPEGPEKPERYPNPQEPQDPFDRPPVKPQGDPSARLEGPETQEPS